MKTNLITFEEARPFSTCIFFNYNRMVNVPKRGSKFSLRSSPKLRVMKRLQT
jgi:hypothetical protein